MLSFYIKIKRIGNTEQDLNNKLSILCNYNYDVDMYLDA